MSVSLQSQRIFHGTTDVSLQLSDYHSTNYAMTYTAGQYFYIGMQTPFNNIYFNFTTPAASTAGAVTVEVWWGNQWISVVDLKDQTSGMTASGRISWALELNKGWEIEEESADVGITGSHVYDKYWLRLSWANNFTASLGFVGQKFSSDTDLSIHYPDLLESDILSGYKAGKTNWNDQHFAAAEFITKDLIKRKVIKAKGQIFDWQTFEEPSVHKVAEIVYRAMGLPYREHAIEAEKRYQKEMAQSMVNFDVTGDGYLDTAEQQDTQGWCTR